LPHENVLSNSRRLDDDTDLGSELESEWHDQSGKDQVDRDGSGGYTFRTTDGAPCWAVSSVQMLEVERMAGE
jgi:hypothetical protein